MEVEQPRINIWREEGISGVGTQRESVRLHSRRETNVSVFVLEELENGMCELIELLRNLLHNVISKIVLSCTCYYRSYALLKSPVL